MRALALVLALAAAPAAPAAEAPGVVVRHADTRLVEEVYRLSARIDYRLSPAAGEALANGVPLTFEVTVEVVQPRRWLWDETLATVRLRSRLRFHALSGRYVLVNLNSGARRTFRRLEAALAAAGTLEAVPVLDRRLLAPGGRYQARLRARLDIEALPAPLRPLAYLSPGWRLASEWYAWRLES
ncbi:DUF4390 domain-containing protein [Inmirania thermothiophila]|uniref:Uncharacterized protein DUF4390 n=1 Tax=Inmirania thermothiophila TaxID=1750597 RepID=A0A3N1Y669_9GAMM|nr:DUF4390 domain-containing protein [Inmirania thermothiophila]ROR34250.1 uncharacterized protein DUF4390 [Inmirania thermothiophila]